MSSENITKARYYTIFKIGISDAIALLDLRVLQTFLPLNQNSLSNTHLSSKICGLRAHDLLVVPVMQRRCVILSSTFETKQISTSTSPKNAVVKKTVRYASALATL